MPSKYYGNYPEIYKSTGLKKEDLKIGDLIAMRSILTMYDVLDSCNFRTIDDIGSKHVITKDYRGDLDIMETRHLDSWAIYRKGE